MPMATIHKVGQGELYHIHFLDQGGVDPGYGQGRPGGRPDQGLPGGGGRPDQGLPGQGGGGIPSNELPETPPPNLAPGWTLVLIRHGQQGKWEYAAIAPGSPPPRPLPPAGGGRPDQGLPPGPDNTLPGGQPPTIGGGPAPPQPTPTPPMAPGGQPHPSPGPVPPMPTPQQR